MCDSAHLFKISFKIWTLYFFLLSANNVYSDSECPGFPLKMWWYSRKSTTRRSPEMTPVLWDLRICRNVGPVQHTNQQLSHPGNGLWNVTSWAVDSSDHKHAHLTAKTQLLFLRAWRWDGELRVSLTSARQDAAAHHVRGHMWLADTLKPYQSNSNQVLKPDGPSTVT